MLERWCWRWQEACPLLHQAAYQPTNASLIRITGPPSPTGTVWPFPQKPGGGERGILGQAVHVLQNFKREGADADIFERTGQFSVFNQPRFLGCELEGPTASVNLTAPVPQAYTPYWMSSIRSSKSAHVPPESWCCSCEPAGDAGRPEPSHRRWVQLQSDELFPDG